MLCTLQILYTQREHSLIYIYRLLFICRKFVLFLNLTKLPNSLIAFNSLLTLMGFLQIIAFHENNDHLGPSVTFPDLLVILVLTTMASTMLVLAVNSGFSQL